VKSKWLSLRVLHAAVTVSSLGRAAPTRLCPRRRRPHRLLLAQKSAACRKSLAGIAHEIKNHSLRFTFFPAPHPPFSATNPKPPSRSIRTHPPRRRVLSPYRTRSRTLAALVTILSFVRFPSANSKPPAQRNRPRGPRGFSGRLDGIISPASFRTSSAIRADAASPRRNRQSN